MKKWIILFLMMVLPAMAQRDLNLKGMQIHHVAPGVETDDVAVVSQLGTSGGGNFGTNTVFTNLLHDVGYLLTNYLSWDSPTVQTAIYRATNALTYDDPAVQNMKYQAAHALSWDDPLVIDAIWKATNSVGLYDTYGATFGTPNEVCGLNLWNIFSYFNTYGWTPATGITNLTTSTNNAGVVTRIDGQNWTIGTNVPDSDVDFTNGFVNGTAVSVTGRQFYISLPTNSFTNAVMTTNSAGVVTWTNRTLYIGTNVPASTDTNVVIALAQVLATNAVNDSNQIMYPLATTATTMISRAMGNKIKLDLTTNIVSLGWDKSGYTTNQPIGVTLYMNLRGFALGFNTNVDQFIGSSTAVAVIPTNGWFSLRCTGLPERDTNAPNISVRQ